MIKTKSVKDPVGESDGDRILVMRYWPRPYSKKALKLRYWLKELAPSKELLAEWNGRKISWQEYKTRYRAEMAEQQAKIQELAMKDKGRIITLLCKEPESDPCCHRHLLKKLIEEVSDINDV